ncbi:protease modulator HflC [Paroceanicella profunda]|uniref:protease modulator HflC n=1 Tax=Paroceanicella profunda TaxID=2579971 RepID=UPI0014791EDD|nr:protease modulator HflC [Paroceanicella profunda]
MKRSTILLGAAAVVVIAAASSVFIVDEREQALVLQFGEVVEKRTDPGIGFKIPFIQNVVKFDKRILALETRELEVTPLDDRRLVVDGFARWRIISPERFRQAVGSEDEAMVRLERILNASLRQELGSVTSNEVLSSDRQALMTRIRDVARTSSEGLGVEIIDVRIRRADLPKQNLSATFNRMKSEREREAADERARGQEAAQIIRAQADRTAVETLSKARKQSEIIRGEADGQRNKIYADAYGRDPEFYAFYRSLEAYTKALDAGKSTMVMTPDSEFFEYLRSAGVPTPGLNGIGLVDSDAPAPPPEAAAGAPAADAPATPAPAASGIQAPVAPADQAPAPSE